MHSVRFRIDGHRVIWLTSFFLSFFQLVLLKALINWALVSSEQIRAIIAENYKGRSEHDLDCPLSVQPWGKDGQKRKYWLIEGNGAMASLPRGPP